MTSYACCYVFKLLRLPKKEQDGLFPGFILSSARLSKLVLLCYTFDAVEQLKKQYVTKEYACFISIFTNYT